MDDYNHERRSFLYAFGGLGMSHMLSRRLSDAGGANGRGAVLAPDGGEHLIHFRDRGNIFIKVSADSSTAFAMGTQQVMTGTGIPIHRHLKMDEAFFVLEGSGTVILNEVRHTFEKGASIFIPKTVWHGFENPDHELVFLWMVTPPGLDSFFRETCSPVGSPPKNLSREEIRAIALKYDTEFR